MDSLSQSGWRAWLAHAFAVEKYDESSLEESEKELLIKLARNIHARGLAPAAILWIASNRHLSWLGSQVMIAAAPVYDLAHQFVAPFLSAIGLYVKPDELPALAEVFTKRYSVEYLVQRIEAAQAGELEAEVSAPPPQD